MKKLAVNKTYRQIIHRSFGKEGHGGITRLMSPSDIGQLIKPFVFLDRFDILPTPNAVVEQRMSEFYHPHSGIMTVTILVEGEVQYEDTTPAAGVLPAGGIEYMIAGGGVWHTGTALGENRAKGFQLWVALPPELENSTAKSVYLPPAEVAQVGPARVILGSFAGAESLVLPALPMNYLHVSLKGGEKWSYTPPKNHNISWVAVREGKLETADLILKNDIAVFAEGNEPIKFTAHGKTDFVLGSAVKRSHPLVLGSYSVHTSEEALAEGESHIVKIRQQLRG